MSVYIYRIFKEINLLVDVYLTVHHELTIY